MKTHTYDLNIEWNGNLGEGTKGYTSYSRNFEVDASKYNPILGSSDPAFRGDHTRYNPEELLVASVSSCHMLWYLHLCSNSKISVVSYIDRATGKMIEQENGSGFFESITLKPKVIIRQQKNVERAQALHQQVHRFCFIAQSLKTEIFCEPSCMMDESLWDDK